MPTRETAPSGAPCWIDLFSADVDRAIDFYGQIFGWTAESTGDEFGGYVNFSRDGVLIAGVMHNDGTEGAPDAWTTYLAADDAKAVAEAAVSAGGHVLLEPAEVGDLGVMAVLGDPGRAPFGLWQPGRHRGYGLIGEPGAPVWHELHTRHYTESVEFYRTVFGWETAVLSDTEDFRYTTMEGGGSSLAGIMDAKDFLPEGMPAAWQVYIGCDDVDATLARAVELGGAVGLPAEDTPFGRLAAISDPTGATIKLSSV